MPRECRTSGGRRPARPGHGTGGHPAARRSAPRALVALAAGVVVAALSVAPAAASSAGPARPAGPGQASPAQPLSVTITSVSPTYATPKGKVTVSGTVTNTTAAAATGLSVQLWSSSVRFPDRGAMASYLTAPTGAGVDSPLRNSVQTLATVPAHSTRPWSLTLRVSQAGMTTFGVYPLAAQLSQLDAQVDAARTFLPFWPAASRARTIGPFSLAWIWPLIDVPHRAACPALLNDGLAASLAGGGRLNQLLAVGGSAVGRSAGLTWAIDPALLSDAKVMTDRYQVGGTATCTHASARPASAAARAWLRGVQSVAAQQDFFVTPYADVDVAALSHRGLNSELADAFADGRQTALAILHGQVQRPPVARAGSRASPGATGLIAWPPNGVADYGVLESLAASPNRIGTVILDDGMMPPAVPANVTPTAVTTTPDGVYGQMHVLLADHGIGQVLATPAGSLPGIAPGTKPSPAAAAFAREQWFLAQTAMIASEAPHTARAVVVAPPRRWDPGAGLASSLLDETAHTPWLRPASLSSLTAAPHPTGQVRRNGPPKYQVSPSELRAPLLGQVRQLNDRIGLLASILVQSGPRYLSTAVAAVESSAWRGQPSGRRTARQLLRKVSTFVAAQQHQVRIIDPLRVTLGGKSGEVPVSIRNRLGQAVTVRLGVSVPSDGRIVIRNPRQLITVPGGQQKTIKIPVKASEAGSTTLTLWLTNPGGRLLPGSTARVTVEATHFGTMAIVIIGIALAVFLITAIGRAIRRGIRQPGGDGDGGAGGTAAPGRDGDETVAAEEGAAVAAEEGAAVPEAGRTAAAGDSGADGADGTGPTGPDPAYTGPEADTVERKRAGRSPAAKEPDEHASTPGWAERR
jgi:Family of unknown function (DUF6049)